MIYLDYSATTKADEKVIEKFVETEQKFFANPNSNHFIGKECKNVIDEAISSICSCLGIKENEFQTALGLQTYRRSATGN